MILFSQNFFKYLSLTVCLLSTWIILGAIPALQMGGRFPQVETQILGLHLLGGILFLIKSMETFFLRKSIKELNNIFFLVTLSIGLLSFLSSFFNKYFYSTILGSNQIGQGAIWYLDFAILILFFSTIVNDNRIRFIYFLNIFLLTIFVSIFTIFPFWKGTNISFFYFNDYLCYFGIINFILLSTFTKNKLIIFSSYILLGAYLNLLDNRAAILLWGIVLILIIIYEILNIISKYEIINKLKNVIFSNLFLSLSVLFGSILILFSSLIFWKGEGAMPEAIASSPIASLVVRGKLIEVVISNFFNLGNILIGAGWGKIPDLLMSQMDAWQFDQLTVGYNLHFHSHNEFFEHFFSLGIPGALLFMYLIYFVFRSAEQISIYNKISWLLFFYVSCFWFFWAGTLPLVALGIGTLVISKKTDLQIVNKFLSNIRPNKIRILSFSLLFFSMVIFFGAYSTYSTITEHKKLSYGALANLSSKQKLSEINCQDYFFDKRGGDSIANMVTVFPNFLKRNKIDYDETQLKILETLQCISEEIIFKYEANLNLLSASTQLDARLFFSSNEKVKKWIDNDVKLENLRNKALILAKNAPKRGDLIMPFLAIALKKNKLAYIDEFCTNPEIQGIEGYCNLISAYKILTTSFASNSDIKKSIQFIEKAINNGVLEEKLYGWWFFDDVTSNAQGFLPNGIPLSADVIYYISAKEAFELLEILKKGQNL